jgi:hypothetical protein
MNEAPPVGVSHKAEPLDLPDSLSSITLAGIRKKKELLQENGCKGKKK